MTQTDRIQPDKTQANQLLISVIIPVHNDITRPRTYLQVLAEQRYANHGSHCGE